MEGRQKSFDGQFFKNGIDAKNRDEYLKKTLLNVFPKFQEHQFYLNNIDKHNEYLNKEQIFEFTIYDSFGSYSNDKVYSLKGNIIQVLKFMLIKERGFINFCQMNKDNLNFDINNYSFGLLNIKVKNNIIDLSEYSNF